LKAIHRYPQSRNSLQDWPRPLCASIIFAFTQPMPPLTEPP